MAAKIRKPKVTTKCVANTYAGEHERIVEFSNGSQSVEDYKGGLIKFWNHPVTGEFHVMLYRMEPGVKVHVAENEA